MYTIKIINITYPTKEEAEKVACHLLEKKLIACANIYPIDSGELEKNNEYILIAKTTEYNYEAVNNEVEKIHSYAVPYIVGILCKVNEKYYTFVQKSVVSDKK